MQRIKGYHAHVYFDASTIEQARALCEEAKRLFGVTMGRVHERPVGPHPDWSCQLAFGPELIGIVLPWLALNRHGLVVFLHPDTGNDLLDGGATVEIAPGTNVDPGSAALVDALEQRWGLVLRLTRPDPGAAHPPIPPRA